MINLDDLDSVFFEEIVKEISSYTVPLFRLNSEEGKAPHGTGVLFYFNDEFFLFTSGHNFAEEEVSKIFISTPNEIIRIGNEAYFSPKLNAIMDFGIVKLDRTVIKILKKYYSFLDLAKVEIGHKQKIISADNNGKGCHYFVLGFPGKKTKLKYNTVNEWKAEGLYFAGFCYHTKIEEFREKGFTLHLFLDYQKSLRDVKSKQKRQLPKLKGMSGCGIWNVKGIDIVTGKPKIKLVGIFNEVLKDSLVFIKLDVFISFLREELGLKKLPKPLNEFKFRK